MSRRPFRQFSILATIDGYDVVCEATGHTVDHRETAQQANGVAYKLNDAAAYGILDQVLGCHESRHRELSR